MFNELETLLKQILNALQELKPNQPIILQPEKKTLWRINDIADYFAMSRTTTEQKIISSPDFPKPFSVNNTQPRWIPEEIVKWSQRKRG